MNANETIWPGENGETAWETSYRCCIMRKVIGKEMATGGRLHSFLDSVLSLL